MCFFFGNLILQRRRYAEIALALGQTQDEILFSACFLAIQPHGKVLSLALALAPPPPFSRPASTRLVLVSFFMRHMCQSSHKAHATHTHTVSNTHTHWHRKDKQGLRWLWEFLIDIGSGQAVDPLPLPRQRVNYSTRYPLPTASLHRPWRLLCNIDMPPSKQRA